VRELLKQALGELEPVLGGDPDERPKHARARRGDGWAREVFLRSAELAAVNGDDLAASRAAWSRLVLWQRHRAEKLAADVEQQVRNWNETLEDLARGSNRRTGKPYAASTLNQKRSDRVRYEAWIDQSAMKVLAMTAVEIPSYRTWRSMMRCEAPANEHPESQPDAETLEVWHQAMSRRQERLAEQERAQAIAHHRLARDREAFDAQQRAWADEVAGSRDALVAERAQLREEVVAGVQRDYADLLREVGELEARRRGALAMLAAGRPPLAALPSRTTSARGSVVSEEERSALVEVRIRLRERGITFDRIATEAGVTRPMVSHCFAGRAKSQRVVETAKRLLAAPGEQ
jgi:hypothetical protein